MVKICGIRGKEDALAAIQAGADYLGFVVGVPSSPRNLPLGAARRLMETVSDAAKKVVVTVRHASESQGRLYLLLKTLPADVIQLHGNELSISGSIRQRFPEVTFVGALTICDESSLKSASSMCSIFDGIHADSHSGDLSGGTGITHDWKLSAKVRELIDPTPLTLAGGLSQHNVAEAIRIVRPFAVDVSTGVESTPGVKDHRKIAEFVKRVREVSL